MNRSDDFDWLCIFDFLCRQNIMEGHLMLLEEIIFKCLRINLSKTFDIICREEISELLWKHSLHHSIFRILYVVVFAQWQNGNFEYLKQNQQEQLSSILKDLFRLPNLLFYSQQKPILADCGDQTLKFRSSLNVEHMLGEFIILMKIIPPVYVSQFLKALQIQELVSTFKRCLEKIIQMSQKRESQSHISQQQQDIDNYQQFLEGITGTLLYTIKIIFDESSLKQLQDLTTSEYHTQIRTKIFQEILSLQNVIENYLTDSNFAKAPISNGQQIYIMGLLRYKLIQLQVSILDKLSHFSYKQELEHNIIVTGNIGRKQITLKFPKFDPLNIVKIYLGLNKWNSIFQHQLIKLIDKTLSHENYTTFFKQTYITKFTNQQQNNPQKPFSRKLFSDTFFGVLVSQFRNKNFVFLSSLRYTSIGNIQTIYKIGQLLLIKCPRQDKNFLMQQFPHFKAFLQEDLKKYSDYLFSNKESYHAGASTGIQDDYVLENIREVVESDRASSGTLLSIVRQSEEKRKSNADIHQSLQSHEKNKLDSVQPIKKRRRKQSLLDCNFIKQLEGLVCDKSNAHLSIK